MTKTKDKVHYVDNSKFYLAILEHKKKCQEAALQGLESPRLSNYIGECIYKIASKLANKPCFMNYSFRDEMIGDAIENSILYFNDYDPERGKNPFAYFTQVTYFAFLRRISKEEKNRYIKYKNFQETIMNNGHSSLLLDADDNHLLSVAVYDNITEFMDRYEKKEEAKKAKRKLAKEGLTKFYEDKENERSKSTSTG
jgi:hypothetical protein